MLLSTLKILLRTVNKPVLYILNMDFAVCLAKKGFPFMSSAEELDVLPLKAPKTPYYRMAWGSEPYQFN